MPLIAAVLSPRRQKRDRRRERDHQLIAQQGCVGATSHVVPLINRYIARLDRELG
jgi:hypothetical protein